MTNTKKHDIIYIVVTTQDALVAERQTQRTQNPSGGDLVRVQIPPDAYIYEKEADGFLFLLIYRKLLIGSINFSIPAGGKQYEKKNVELYGNAEACHPFY